MLDEGQRNQLNMEHMPVKLSERKSLTHIQNEIQMSRMKQRQAAQKSFVPSQFDDLTQSTMIPHGHSNSTRQRSILTFKQSNCKGDSLIDHDCLSSPMSQRTRTNQNRFRLKKIATNMELPAQIKKIFAQGESQSSQAFKVLQEA